MNISPSNPCCLWPRRNSLLCSRGKRSASRSGRCDGAFLQSTPLRVPWRGRVFTLQRSAWWFMVRGARCASSRSDGVISGYLLGSPDSGESRGRIVVAVTGSHPAARLLLHPVIVDVARGVALRRAFRMQQERMLPIRDVVTAQSFELDYLWERPIVKHSRSDRCTMRSTSADRGCPGDLGAHRMTTPMSVSDLIVV